MLCVVSLYRISTKPPFYPRTAFGTTFDKWSPRNLLFLLDSFESAASSPGHHQTPYIAKKSKENLEFWVLWDHFRDRFWDHFRQFWTVDCQVWRAVFGCAG